MHFVDSSAAGTLLKSKYQLGTTGFKGQPSALEL
jgi:hypothetical protein